MRRNLNFSFYILFEKHFLQCVSALCYFLKMQATRVQNQYIKGFRYAKKGFHCKRGGSPAPYSSNAWSHFTDVWISLPVRKRQQHRGQPRQGQGFQFLILGAREAWAQSCFLPLSDLQLHKHESRLPTPFLPTWCSLQSAGWSAVWSRLPQIHGLQPPQPRVWATFLADRPVAEIHLLSVWFAFRVPDSSGGHLTLWEGCWIQGVPWALFTSVWGPG